MALHRRMGQQEASKKSKKETLMCLDAGPALSHGVGGGAVSRR